MTTVQMEVPTLEEAYTKIREYFTREGAQLSVGKKKGPYATPRSCYYRHPEDGRKCSIGVLIPDEVVTKMNNSEMASTAMLTEHCGWDREDDYDMLKHMFRVQIMHDEAHDVEGFIHKLDKYYEENK